MRCNKKTIEDFGLNDFHSYTMMQCKAVRLQKDSTQLRYLMQLRNPWGAKEWKGPWCDGSKTWEHFPDVKE